MDALATPVSQEVIYLYHSIDRRLYAILALELCVDPVKALHIMAFWISLERIGFRNTVGRILSLSPPVITQLAKEAISCLNYIENSRFLLLSGLSVSETQRFISEKLSLKFLSEKMPEIAHHLAQVMNLVCDIALKDIMREAQERNAAWLRAEWDMTISSLPDPAFLIGGDERRLPRKVNPDDRTLFVTFSRGYPVVEKEMLDFLVGYYGDCIESLHMQEVEFGEQVLYARVVFRTVSTLEHILSGMEKVKFVVNGKHVWARKFVPKKGKASRK